MDIESEREELDAEPAGKQTIDFFSGLFPDESYE